MVSRKKGAVFLSKWGGGVPAQIFCPLFTNCIYWVNLGMGREGETPAQIVWHIGIKKKWYKLSKCRGWGVKVIWTKSKRTATFFGKPSLSPKKYLFLPPFLNKLAKPGSANSAFSAETAKSQKVSGAAKHDLWYRFYPMGNPHCLSSEAGPSLHLWKVRSPLFAAFHTVNTKPLME